MIHARYIIIAMLLSLVITGCVALPEQLPASEPTSSGSEPPTKVKAQTLPLLSFAPYFIAQEEGYFSDEGLDVEFVQFQRSSDAIPALLQGDLDVIAGTTSFSLLNAILKDGRIKIVADKGYIATEGCSHQSLLASNAFLASKDTSGDPQLAGRRFAINPNAVQGFFTEKILADYGLSLDDIEINDIPDPTISESFANGAIDFAAASEPWVTRVIQSGTADIWIDAGDFAPDFQLGVLSYGPNLLTEDGATGQRFMLAYLKAVQQYNEGKTERNLEILSKYTELDIPLLQATCWPAMRNTGEVNVESLLEFAEWGTTKDLLDGNVTADALFDGQFIEYARTAGVPEQAGN